MLSPARVKMELIAPTVNTPAAIGAEKTALVAPATLIPALTVFTLFTAIS